MPYKNPEDRRAYQRKWEKEHPDKVREYRKIKYERHGDKIRARNYEYYRRPEVMTRENARYYRRTPELEAKRELRRLWQESPRSRRRFYRHSKYLTYAEYKQILPQLENGGPCDCCGRMDELMHIDHCHDRMKFRGVLCSFCNKGLGHFGDDPDLLLKAAAYLHKSML